MHVSQMQSIIFIFAAVFFSLFTIPFWCSRALLLLLFISLLSHSFDGNTIIVHQRKKSTTTTTTPAASAATIHIKLRNWIKRVWRMSEKVEWSKRDRIQAITKRLSSNFFYFGDGSWYSVSASISSVVQQGRQRERVRVWKPTLCLCVFVFVKVCEYVKKCVRYTSTYENYW